MSHALYVDPRAPGHQRWTLKAVRGRWKVWNAPPVMEEDEGRLLELQPGVETPGRCEVVPERDFKVVIERECPRRPEQSNGVRSLPGFAEFAEAFCAGFIACREGLTDDDGEEYIRGLMAAYESSGGQRARVTVEAHDRERSKS